MEFSVMWSLGDCLRYEERAYGEKYAQALDATDYACQTIADAKWVAGRFEISRRRENLTWSHHREVAGIEDDAEQENRMQSLMPLRPGDGQRKGCAPRLLIEVEKSWRDAQVAILFGKASRKAAFATNDSGRYWRLSGARQSGGRRAKFWRSYGAQNRR